MPLISPNELVSSPYIRTDIDNLHNENDEYTVEFPPMCEFERIVILEFAEKLCSEDDNIRFVNIKDLVNIIVTKFNEIVDIDRQQNNSRSVIDRMKSIGFTPVANPEGKLNIYYNPMCSYILYTVIYNMAKDDDHEKLPHIRNLMLELWPKFLDYYFPNVEFIEQ